MFGDHYLNFTAWLGYERNLQCEITNYKGVDKDKSINEYFEALLIDTKNDYVSESKLFYPKSERFHSSIDQLQSSESSIIVNTLDNNAF